MSDGDRRRQADARLLVLDTGPASRPADLEIAVSHALLSRVGAGELPPLIRLYRPAPTVAFGRLDANSTGYGEAVEVTRRHGFEPAVRLAGGRAAAYDHGSLVCEEISAGESGPTGIGDRFERFSRQLLEALTALGAEAAIGELPDEYCPGRYSVHVGGRLKVVGIAQRATRRAALTSASILVCDGAAVRAVLRDVYRALSLELDPATIGALDEELPGVRVDAVATELVARLQGGGELAAAGIDAETMALATELLPRHQAQR